jgi:hypothetical protein
MDKEIEMLRDEITVLKAKQKTLQLTLANLRSTPTTTDLRESTEILVAEISELLNRLSPLRSGKISPVSTEEKAAVDEGCAIAERKSALRKKIFKDLWGMTCDNLPEGTSKDELWVSVSLCSTCTPSYSLPFCLSAPVEGWVCAMLPVTRISGYCLGDVKPRGCTTRRVWVSCGYHANTRGRCITKA